MREADVRNSKSKSPSYLSTGKINPNLLTPHSSNDQTTGLTP